MQLTKLRKNKNLTQKELASQVGVSRALISMIEIGSVRAYPSLRKRIAKALETRVSEIWGENE